MRCDYAFLCDFAMESSGKLYALGIGWSTIQAQSVPVNCPQICFVASLTGTIAEAGTKEAEFRLIDADGADVIPPLTPALAFAVQEPALEGRLNIILNLNGVTFQQYGRYAFHLVVQGNEMVQAPFSVIAVTPTA